MKGTCRFGSALIQPRMQCLSDQTHGDPLIQAMGFYGMEGQKKGGGKGKKESERSGAAQEQTSHNMLFLHFLNNIKNFKQAFII